MARGKRLISVLILAVIVTALAGTMTASSASPVTIEFWTIKLKDAFSEYFENVIAAFEKANPNIKVNWVDVANVTEKLTAAVAGNVAPDLVDNLSPAMWASQGVFLNIDKYVPKSVRDQYSDAYWNGGCLYKGGHYGIPFYGWGVNPLWYNKDAFKAAGLDPNKPPTTDFEMLEMSKKIHDATGKYGYSFQTYGWGDRRVWDIFAKEDLGVFKGKKPKLATKQAIEILQKWVDAYKAKAIPPEAVTGTGRDPMNWFIDERATMFIQSGWITRYFTPALNPKIGLAPQPKGQSGKVLVIDPDWLSVPKTSKHPKEAIAFALFLTNAQNSLEFAKLAGSLPPHKAALNDPYFDQPPASLKDEARNLAVKQMKTLPCVVACAEAQPWIQLMDILKEEVDKAFLGQQTAEQALRNTEQRWIPIYQPQ